MARRSKNERPILAAAFTQYLKCDLDAEQWNEMVRLNEKENDIDCCHSHDYVDANDTMLRAFEETLGREPSWLTHHNDGERELHDTDFPLWNAAWSDAQSSWQSVVTCPNCEWLIDVERMICDSCDASRLVYYGWILDTAHAAPCAHDDDDEPMGWGIWCYCSETGQYDWLIEAGWETPEDCEDSVARLKRTMNAADQTDPGRGAALLDAWEKFHERPYPDHYYDSMAEQETFLTADPQPGEAACPCGGGPLVLLGTLGNLTWARCRECGLDVSLTITATIPTEE